MKLEFDVKVTEKDLYSFNIEQAYKGSHFAVDEKHINVSQGEEMAQLPWEQVYRFVANDKRILIFSNRKNAYILSKEQLGDSYEPLKELAGSTLEKYRLKIK